MKTASSMAKDLEALSGEEQYDAACKRLLSQKSLLAWIMKTCLWEYKDASLEEIRTKYIEGQPQVAVVPVERDETNAERIVGDNNEDKSRREGTTTYDIIFTALLPGTGEPVYLVINVEAQGSIKLKYPLIKRGIYYAGRILTAENGRYFSHSEYGKIRKVYSIWICMNPQAGRENTIAQYHVTKDFIEGEYEEPLADYDLVTVVLINVGQEQQQKARSILRLLRILFSKSITAQEKEVLMETEYGIPMTKELKEGVKEMCNLGETLAEESWDYGRKEGIIEGREGTALNMLRRLVKRQQPIDSQAVADIAEDTELTIVRVQELARDNGFVLQ